MKKKFEPTGHAITLLALLTLHTVSTASADMQDQQQDNVIALNPIMKWPIEYIEAVSKELEANGYKNFDNSAQANYRNAATNVKRNFDEIDNGSIRGFRNGKRNFDDVNRSGLAGFNGKRNFDEIDRVGFTGFNKRQRQPYNPNLIILKRNARSRF